MCKTCWSSIDLSLCVASDVCNRPSWTTNYTCPRKWKKRINWLSALKPDPPNSIPPLFACMINYNSGSSLLFANSDFIGLPMYTHLLPFDPLQNVLDYVTSKTSLYVMDITFTSARVLNLGQVMIQNTQSLNINSARNTSSGKT